MALTFACVRFNILVRFSFDILDPLFINFHLFPFHLFELLNQLFPAFQLLSQELPLVLTRLQLGCSFLLELIHRYFLLLDPPLVLLDEKLKILDFSLLITFGLLLFGFDYIYLLAEVRDTLDIHLPFV